MTNVPRCVTRSCQNTAETGKQIWVRRLANLCKTQLFSSVAKVFHFKKTQLFSSLTVVKMVHLKETRLFICRNGSFQGDTTLQFRFQNGSFLRRHNPSVQLSKWFIFKKETSLQFKWFISRRQLFSCQMVHFIEAQLSSTVVKMTHFKETQPFSSVVKMVHF